MPSDLEHAVLGLLWSRQPCTAYAVRMVFQQSPSSHWSGSAGAIYPLMRRLERRGLLKSTAKRGDGRSVRLYRLTSRGHAQLKAWLRPPLPPGSSLMDIDPLRLRVLFLGALNDGERRRFVEEARAKLRQQLRRVRAAAEQDRLGNDAYRYLVSRGALLSVKAQLAWLAEVGRALAPAVRRSP